MILIRHVLIIGLLFLQSLSQGYASKGIRDSFAIGVTRLETIDNARERRPVVIEMWYPVAHGQKQKATKSTIFYRSPAVRDAIPYDQGKPYPLLVMSHSQGGNRMDLSWLAEKLAASGFIVASVDHFGATSYHQTVRETLGREWERPLDLSFTITYLLTHSQWSRFINPHKIGAIGLEMGGFTAIWAAGPSADLEAFLKERDQYIDWQELPDFAKKQVQSIDPHSLTASYYEPRIKAVFAIAPNRALSFTPDNLKRIEIPVHIVYGAGDKVLLSQESALYYARHIPGSHITEFKGKVTSFSFLSTCTPIGQKALPGICTDHPSVKRSAIHKKVVRLAKDFFTETLQP